MSNYESRLERLEQQIAVSPSDQSGTVIYLHDSDGREEAWTEVRGERFDRRADENVDDFIQRVMESTGVVDRPVIVVSYVGSDGNGRPIPTNVDAFLRRTTPVKPTRRQSDD